MQLNYIFLLIALICHFSGCIKAPEGPGKENQINNFTERKIILSYDKVMRELPNILDLRSSVDVIVSDNIDVSKMEGIKLSLIDSFDGRTIYRGSVLGVYKLPKNRIKVPIKKLTSEVVGVFQYPNGDIFKVDLPVLNGGEVLIQAKFFNHSRF